MVTPKRISPKVNETLIHEVRSTFEEAEANKLLATGKWQLLHGCVAHKDSLGYQAYPCWLLGRSKK